MSIFSWFKGNKKKKNTINSKDNNGAIIQDAEVNYKSNNQSNTNIKNQINIENNDGQSVVANDNSKVTVIQNKTSVSKKEFAPHKKIMYTNLGMLSPTFVGRDKYVNEIDSLFDKQRVIILSANGGIGKTQIVLKYIEECKKNYEHIAFINASSGDAILQDYANLLNIDNDENLLARIREWSNTNNKWLFVYDNLDDENLKKEFLKKYVVEGKGKIIVTSRLSNWKEKSIHIGEFELDESINLLEMITELNDNEGAKRLSNILNNYPLALDQAGAYIKNIGKNYDEYIKIFQNKKYKLRILDKEQPDIYHHTIAKTWQISFDRITNEASKELLNILSYLDSNDIPKELFFEGIDKLPECLKNTLKDELDSDDVFIQLDKYSLIKIVDNKIYIHNLVQDVVRYTLLEKEQIEWFKIVENLICKVFNYDYFKHDDWVWNINLTLHVLSIINISNEYNIKSKKLINIINDSGWLYYDNGKYKESERFFLKALIINKSSSKLDYLEIAHSYNNLGFLYNIQGKYEKSEKYFLKCKNIRHKKLNKNHPDIATIYNNLGLLYKDKKMYQLSKKFLFKALKIRILIYGKNHYYTAIIYNNLGLLYYLKKNLTQTRYCFLKTFCIIKKQFDDKHPSIATCYNNLGLLYYLKKNYSKSKLYFLKSLKIRENIFGTENIFTAITYYDLGILYNKQNLNLLAKEYLLKALKIRLKFLNPTHPDIVEIYQNLNKICIK